MSVPQQPTRGTSALALVHNQSPTVDPERIWDARPRLRHIHDFARAQMACPWATLGVVLTRVVAATTPQIALPDFIGSYGTLNLYLGLVGGSAAGKGTATSTAEDAVPVGPITKAGIGSGKGIVHLFMRREKAEQVQHNNRALLDVPEVDTFAGLGRRSGNILLPELRKAWSGEALGATNADKDKTLNVDRHSYRLCLILGIQPTRVGVLLDDAGGGTPQRFLWLPAHDPDAPSETPPRLPPQPWTLSPPPTSARRVVSANGIGLVILDVCGGAEDTTRAIRLAHLRGQGGDLDGHGNYTRLKVAGAFGLLDQRYSITEDDWTLSELIMAKSDATRATVMAEMAEATAQANAAKGKADAARAVITRTVLDDHDVKRVGRTLLRKVGEAGRVGLSHAELRRVLPSRDRDYFEDAIERQIGAGMIETERSEKGTRYRLIGGGSDPAEGRGGQVDMSTPPCATGCP